MAVILTYDPVASPEVGRLLADVREGAGFSREQMARFTGYTVRQVKNWELGSSPVKRSVVIAYAVAAERDPEQLVEEVARLIDPTWARTTGWDHVWPDAA